MIVPRHQISMTLDGGPHRFLAMGTYLTADGTVEVIESVLGSAKSFPLPRQLFWVWGKLGDLAKRFGKDLVVTSDGYKFMFNSKPGDDSATTATTGVVFRPVTETFADTFRWMHEAGLAKAEDLGTLLDA